MGFVRLNRAPVRRVPTPVRLLLACEAALGGLYLLDWVAGHPSAQISHIVNLDGEANLPTWFSSMQLFALGLLVAASTGPTIKWRERRTWPVLAVVALFIAMSLDEVAQIHEWFAVRGERLLFGSTQKAMRSVLPNTGLWMVFAAPPFIATFVLLWRRVRRTLGVQHAVAQKYLLGFAVFTGSAFGMEFVANFATPGALSGVLAVVCEELGEMAGVTILISATLDLLAARRPHIAYRPKVHPPEYVARVS